jgi:SAM-dependent methyltransferase
VSSDSPYAYPALEQRHLASPRLFADRLELIRALAFPAPPLVAEVGVAHGDFSEFLIRTLAPARFVAFDFFNLHEHEFVWSYRTSELFEGKTHGDYYAGRMAALGAAVEVRAGNIAETLDGIEDGGFDLIYVDAGHEYADVARDAAVAVRKMKPGGLLIFNDYIMVDHHYGTPYGVVRAVNELVNASDWKVVGFALQQQMFSDIALCRGPAPWAQPNITP